MDLYGKICKILDENFIENDVKRKVADEMFEIFDEGTRELQSRLHEELSDDCTEWTGDLKFCPNRLSRNNVCKHCSEYK